MSRHCAMDSYKTEPDQTDRSIMAMFADGFVLREIAAEFGFSHQSVERRIRWLQARRWATADSKMLTAQEREKLLDAERRMFPK